jgi:aminoglycoside/choline kinase family phosphotransferase
MDDFDDRLIKYLRSRGQPIDFTALDADASTRRYYRVHWSDGGAVACVYPEPFDPASQPYIDVTRLFLAAGLPVAHLLDFEGDLGVIIQEDLGDHILRDVLVDSNDERRSELLDEAISIVARIQAATPLAFKRGSIASRLKFDSEKLLWELDYFKEHYFGIFSNRPLSAQAESDSKREFSELAADLESYASVLCHRDFHAANLMLDDEGRMRIIDHQDARIGSASYDLVSLLLDRITDVPTAEWLAEKRRRFLSERVGIGLPETEENAFENEFDLQTIQRCLKAAGTFSFQSAARGKTHFVPFIKPLFRAALAAIERVDRFPALKRILEVQINEN